jgi:uncharacterized membrane protein YfcA
VRLLGYDFLNASASAKLLNLASNAAALLLFSLKGHVWWHFRHPAGRGHVLGSMLGTWMACATARALCAPFSSAWSAC